MQVEYIEARSDRYAAPGAKRNAQHRIPQHHASRRSPIAHDTPTACASAPPIIEPSTATSPTAMNEYAAIIRPRSSFGTSRCSVAFPVGVAQNHREPDTQQHRIRERRAADERQHDAASPSRRTPRQRRAYRAESRSPIAASVSAPVSPPIPTHASSAPYPPASRPKPIAREDRHEREIRNAEHREHGDEPDERPDRPACRACSEVLRASPRAADQLRRRNPRRQSDEEQSDEHGDVAQRVDAETPRHAELGDDRARRCSGRRRARG